MQKRLITMHTLVIRRNSAALGLVSSGQLTGANPEKLALRNGTAERGTVAALFADPFWPNETRASDESLQGYYRLP